MSKPTIVEFPASAQKVFEAATSSAVRSGFTIRGTDVAMRLLTFSSGDVTASAIVEAISDNRSRIIISGDIKLPDTTPWAVTGGRAGQVSYGLTTAIGSIGAVYGPANKLIAGIERSLGPGNKISVGNEHTGCFILLGIVAAVIFVILYLIGSSSSPS